VRGFVRRALSLRLVASVVAALAAVAQLQAAPARNFIWKVSSRQSVIYVVGSVHLLTPDFYPLAPAVDNAYKDCDLLVEEVDIGEMGIGAQFSMVQRGMLPSTQPLDKILSASTMALLNKKAGSLGLPLEALMQLKPWMISLTIEALQWQNAGFDADLGLDKHFYDIAKADNKNVQGLETVEYQISRFDEMPMSLQDHMLSETLNGIDTEQANMSKMIDAWRSGDAASLERIVLKDLQQEPELYRRLLVERNRNWMPKLEALLTRRTHAMVVVGAAHLVGPDGLVTALRAKGYTVEQQ
jgi:hypothetical protein